MKIVIEVLGGCVQNVFADGDVTVELIDGDNLKAEGKSSEEIEALLDAACANMMQVF